MNGLETSSQGTPWPKPAADLDSRVAQLNALNLYLRFHTGNQLVNEAAAADGWLYETDLTQLCQGPQTRIIDRLSRSEFGASRRAVSASVLLRYGWSAGFLIGTYLTSGAVLRGARLQLRFTPAHAALADVAVLSVTSTLDRATHSLASLRQALSDELVSHAHAIVEAHHQWSGFSRRALWSMVTSSWGAQFAHISERIGAPERGLEEANLILKLDPSVAPARPDLYMVEADGKQGVCQMRRLCCLWFKSGQRQFCASCPIIPADDRLERNRKWIARTGRPIKRTAAGGN